MLVSPFISYPYFMLIAGTNTTNVTLEWAMSHLHNHTHALKQAAQELEQERLINEADIAQLPYLGNSTFETRRSTFASAHVIRGLHHRWL